MAIITGQHLYNKIILTLKEPTLVKYLDEQLYVENLATTPKKKLVKVVTKTQ